jgi:hypothetical protein
MTLTRKRILIPIELLMNLLMYFSSVYMSRGISCINCKRDFQTIVRYKLYMIKIFSYIEAPVYW